MRASRPACNYLLFQLFPRLWVGEKVVCTCMCVMVWRWVGGGEMEGSWGRKIERKREKMCVLNLSESVSCSYYAAVCLHSGNTSRKPMPHTVLYTLSFTHAHWGRWSPVCACPHANTPICLAAPHIGWSASQTQSHKGWPRFQHMQAHTGREQGNISRKHTHLNAKYRLYHVHIQS